MTTTLQHIADLNGDEWAALTRRAAVEAVAAAKKRGKTPPPELVAVATMTERQLLDRRARNGQARQRLSPLMQLVEADQLRRPGSRRMSHRASPTRRALRPAQHSSRSPNATLNERRSVRPQPRRTNRPCN